ncbi:hypothetical protein JCGZ_00613 [Jatropha curcas]|uniref:Late embryogenesis abundant protein LEA-2 subgroup domain-containing protein n=1 Tax=Jatropha curcas TaxID=180498 RepID=A0A067JD98_JATCU|nr:hypothetical protein JCGZ_00613 [Jatropha curcas]
MPMTETGNQSLKAKKRRRCIIIQLVSATLDGISPRLSFPVVNLQLNITLNLNLLLYNPNYASFKHGRGKSILYYNDSQVGEADIEPGYIPSRGSVTFPCRLTVQVDEIASNLASVIRDLLDGEIVMESRTRIPGRATLLGFKRHVVAISRCKFTINVSDMKIENQECKTETKL